MNFKLSILLTALILASCKTTHTLTQQTTNTEVATQQQQEAVVKVNPVKPIIEQIQKNQPQFRSANVSKMTIEMNMGERKVNVSANCKIKKDTAMFISFQVFGLEIFKAELMPENMRVFDKMNRRYFQVDYSYFSKRFGVDVDYYSLQSLFAGQFFCIGKRDILADSCKLGEQSTINFESGNMLQSTEISAQNIIQQVLLKAKNSNYQLQANYKDYVNTNGVNFPQKINILASDDKTKAICNFSILAAEFNTNLKLQPMSTDRYTLGDIDQLLKK